MFFGFANFYNFLVTWYVSALFHRYYGRCILFLMIEHPDLDRLIEKHLPKANVRPAKDIVENLKSKVCCSLYSTWLIKKPCIV